MPQAPREQSQKTGRSLEFQGRNSSSVMLSSESRCHWPLERPVSGFLYVRHTDSLSKCFVSITIPARTEVLKSDES